jgi:hypothetical protein
MTILSKIFVAAAIGCVVTGCSQVPVVYTMTSGSHIRSSDTELADSQKPDKPKPARRYVVWGNHQGAINAVIETLQQAGERVVERARLQEIFDEQKISLTHSAEDDMNLLRVGKLAGADRVIFIETTERTVRVMEQAAGQGWWDATRDTLNNFALRLEAAGAVGAGRTPLWMQQQHLAQQHQQPPPNPVTVYRPSVTVRAVRIDTSEITWSGSSTTSQAVNDLEIAIPILTKAAMVRAVCPIERGAEWIEYASDGSRNPWGCNQKQNR